MKNLRKIMTALVMAAMMSLTAVTPASAAGYDTLSVYNYGGIQDNPDYSYVYGDHASIYVENDGWNATDGAMTYELYDLNWGLLAEGTLSYNTSFSGEFETDTGGFFLRIECDYYSNSCRGHATIDVRDTGPGGGIIYQDHSQYYSNPIPSGHYDNTSTVTITKPGATNIRVHFTNISTVYGHAHVTTSAGDYYEGSYSDVYSGWVSGDSIVISVTDDGAFAMNDGFTVDYIEYTTQ